MIYGHNLANREFLGIGCRSSENVNNKQRPGAVLMTTREAAERKNEN
jgi:hypothetical protein